MRIFWNQLSIVGSTMGDMDEFRQSTSFFRSGSLEPTIDCVIDASDGIQAWSRLEAGEQFGKIVLNWS